MILRLRARVAVVRALRRQRLAPLQIAAQLRARLGCISDGLGCFCGFLSALETPWALKQGLHWFMRVRALVGGGYDVEPNWLIDIAPELKWSGPWPRFGGSGGPYGKQLRFRISHFYASDLALEERERSPWQNMLMAET